MLQYFSRLPYAVFAGLFVGRKYKPRARRKFWIAERVHGKVKNTKAVQRLIL